MKFEPQTPPRKFQVGRTNLTLSDCGRVRLDPDEQVTFTLKSGAEYDVARKSWGFYALPSLAHRLPRFGLFAVLVKGEDGKHFVQVVEKGHEAEHLAYLESEGLRLIARLDDPAVLERIGEVKHTYSFPGCLCGVDDFEPVFQYDSPPDGETRFDFQGGPYRREVMRCRVCGHYISRHDLDMSGLYDGQYVDSTYADEEGLLRTFERIVNLPPEKSDNAGRATRTASFLKERIGGDPARVRVLDVGSGLCVFLHRLKTYGFDCTALDPDERAVRHARENVGVKATQGDFLTVENLGEFDLITFNKVLEHVPDPIAMLSRSREFLKMGGYVYLELPDGRAAESEGPGREEFFIDHHHVFSPASTCLLAEKAGFRTEVLETLREPSSKFTIRAFLSR